MARSTSVGFLTASGEKTTNSQRLQRKHLESGNCEHRWKGALEIQPDLQTDTCAVRHPGRRATQNMN